MSRIPSQGARRNSRSVRTDCINRQTVSVTRANPKYTFSEILCKPLQEHNASIAGKNVLQGGGTSSIKLLLIDRHSKSPKTFIWENMRFAFLQNNSYQD